MSNSLRTGRARASRAWIALTLIALTPAASANTPINETKAVNPSGTIEISNSSGSVAVSTWQRNEVQLTGSLGADVERLEFTQSGNITRVKVILPADSDRAKPTDLIVKMPAASDLSVNSVSADIEIEGVLGAQRLQAVSGNIDTDTAAEDAEFQTVSGDVSVHGIGKGAVVTITTVSGDAVVVGDGVEADINVTTVSGDAILSDVSGEVNGSTVSGDLAVTATAISRSRLRSTSGDLGLRSALGSNARIDLESTSGDVRVDVANPVNGAFDVSSFSGEIRSCFGPKPSRTSEYAPGSELRFAEGDGAARVRIRTMSGDVRLCNK